MFAPPNPVPERSEMLPTARIFPMFVQRSRTLACRQQGTTLVVVLVLVLLATIMALFAVKVNLSEQRSSGNDVKTRLMREVAEAAMAQGMEYMQSLRTAERDPFIASTWFRCTAADTTFPCGAVPVDDGNGHVRRANMYYYKGGYDVNGDGTTDVMED